MFKRALAATAAAVIAGASLATPAHADDTSLIGLVIGTNTVGNLSCGDLKSTLEAVGVYDANDTRDSLRAKVSTKIASIAGGLDANGLLGAKVATDVAARADECNLVKKDPLSMLSSQIGSSDLSKLNDMRGLIEPLLGKK